MERVILHCDMNNFYASVECLSRPDLKGKPVAVGGSIEARHGIILAKNYEAKKYGVSTGEPIIRATEKCPALVILPPHYDKYAEFSRRAQQIYYRYTDRIEPFGDDECWLDVTGSQRLFGDGKKIADTIREEIKNELGLTISVGVSFNKTFAKLGSDMKKPDATTVISRESFKSRVWPLSACEMIGVGPSTSATLARYGIRTLGQLAQAHLPMIESVLGKNGVKLYEAANGRDFSPVMSIENEMPMKSIGHGTTTSRDMETPDEVKTVMLALCEEIGHRLILSKKRACGVSISLRDNSLFTKQYQKKLALSTDSYSIIAREAFSLMMEKHRFDRPLRSVSVTAIDLLPSCSPSQMSFFSSCENIERSETLDRVMDGINRRYGDGMIRYGLLISNSLSDIRHSVGFGVSAKQLPL